jgi:hypothetical protein
VNDIFEVGATIIDNVMVDNVSAVLTWPNLTQINLSLIQTGDRYNLSFNSSVNGSYSVNFTAYDNSSNVNSVVVGFSLINPIVDIISPTFSNVLPVNGSSENLGDNINIQIDVFDDVVVDNVSCIVLLPNGTSREFLMVNSSDTYNYFYTLEILGLHNVSFVMYDSSSNMNYTSVLFDVVDSQGPSISSISPSNGSALNVNDTFEIGATIIDNVMVENVTAVLTWPNLTQVDLSLVQIGDRYNVSFNSSVNGSYSVNFTAYDNSSNVNSVVVGFSLTEMVVQSFLVQGSVAQADIVVDENASNMVILAADLFQMYTYNMTNATLPISNEPNASYSYHVYIGQSNYTDALNITSDGCENGGYKIESGEDYLVFIGQDDVGNVPVALSEVEWSASLPENDTWDDTYPLSISNTYNSPYDINSYDGKGSMNAMHAFLHDQGVRWYYPSETGTIIPHMENLSFGNISKLVNPDFKMRSPYIYYKTYSLLRPDLYNDYSSHMQWQLAMGLNDVAEYIRGPVVHGMNAILWNNQTIVDHPEYYAIWDGLRMDGINGSSIKPDLCSDGLLNETIRYAKHVFDVYNGSTISIMPSDGFTKASESSPECKALENESQGGRGLLSDYVWEFVNNVAWAIYDDPSYGPNKTIICGAYTEYQRPPLNLSDPRGFAPNIAVILTKWRSENYVGGEWRDYNRDILDQWNNVSESVYTYDYYLFNRVNYTSQALPAIYPHIIAEDLLFHKNKSDGEFMEAYSNWPAYNLSWDTFAADSLNLYVIYQMYWNVSLDVDMLLDEYYELYYGPFNKSMKIFVNYSENNYMYAREDQHNVAGMRQMLIDILNGSDNESIYTQRVQALLDLVNSNYLGAEVNISSCQELTSPSTTYYLTQNVSSSGTCFEIDADNVTLDCQGHTITYSTAGAMLSEYGVYSTELYPTNNFRGDYAKVKNCIIQDGSYLNGTTSGAGIFLYAVDNALIENNFINASWSGIEAHGAGQNNTYIDNSVYANTDAGIFMQYGTAADGNDVVSSNYFENNYLVL